MGALALAQAGGARAPAQGQAQPQASTRNESLDRALEQQEQPTLKEFESAWNRDDAKAMASTFREDAVLINPSGHLARGRAEIERLFQREHSETLKGTRFSHRVTDIRQVAPGVALVDEEITVAGAHDPGGRAVPDFHVHASMLMASQGGKWQVVDGRAYRLAPRRSPQDEGIGSGGESPSERPPMANPQGGSPATPGR